MAVYHRCPRCQRHVRSRQRICPFCASRTTGLALGAALAALGTTACESKRAPPAEVAVYGPPPALLDAGSVSNRVPVYGPPPGVGRPEGGSSVALDAAGPVTVYGPPPLPIDAGKR